MNVWVFSKAGDWHAPEAVVLSGASWGDDYRLQPFILQISREQPAMSRAFNEVARLSADARAEMGITDTALEELRKRAAPEAKVQSGDALYLTITNGEDGNGPDRANGVYTFRPDEDSFTRVRSVKVYGSMQEYDAQQRRDKVASEVAGVSAETRSILSQLRPK